MRRVLHLITAMISCCFLCFIDGCGPDLTIDGDRGDAKADINDGKRPISGERDRNVDDDSDEDSLPTDQAPAIVPPIDEIPPPPAIIPVPEGNGYGGGSQGALQPELEGNEDDEEIAGPNGVCGNGVQEVLPNSNACPYRLYGTTTSGPNGPSELIAFDLSQDGVGYSIAQIGPNIVRVSSLDFSPDGVLYGVGERADTGESVLITINCRTGAAVIIGETDVQNTLSDYTFTDIDWDYFGRLWGYTDRPGGGGQPERLWLLNPLTGLAIDIGITNTPGASLGNGIGTAPFPNGPLNHANDVNVSTLNETTGNATITAPLIFTPPLDNGPRINGMDQDPFTGIVYVSINDTDEFYLGTLNVNTGLVSLLSAIPPTAPEGLDSIAVNRRFEECDPQAQTPIPAGTTCFDDCTLHELQCNDKLDNDGDTLIDCEDPDCLNQPCNDMDGCTIQDTCREETGEEERIAEPICVGISVNCDEVVGNECAMNMCLSLSMDAGDDHFKCNSMFDTTKTGFGSCTPEGNCSVELLPNGQCPEGQEIDQCLVGRCIEVIEDSEPPVFTCESETKTQITVSDGGCKDGESCTADMCKSGICMYSDLDQVPCSDGNVCTSSDTCNMGVCEGVNNDSSCDDGNTCTIGDSCNNGVCSGSNLPNSCGTNAQCSGGTCQGVTLGLCGAGVVPCSGPGTCPPNTCIMGQCQPSNIAACSVDADCQPSQCNFFVAGTCACSDGNQCTSPDRCLDGSCASTPLNSGACDDGVACTSNTVCLNGQCDSAIFNDDQCVFDPGNPCVMGTCTLTGCKSTLMTGPTQCTIGNPCLIGTQQCEQGEIAGPCVPNDPPFLCAQ